MRKFSSDPIKVTLGVLVTAGLILFAGPATAVINMYCDCTPSIDIEDKVCCSPPNPTLKYCQCSQSNTISGLATHQFNRNCTQPGAFGWNLRDSDFDVPRTMVRDIPSHVTCTNAWQSMGSTIFYYNQCTNWNLSKKSVTVLTWCGGDYFTPYPE